jgi:hypothetical protein
MQILLRMLMGVVFVFSLNKREQNLDFRTIHKVQFEPKEATIYSPQRVFRSYSHVSENLGVLFHSQTGEVFKITKAYKKSDKCC